MAQKRIISATVELVVEGEPGDAQAMDAARELVGQELQVERRKTGVSVRSMRGETIVGVEED